MKQFFRKRFPSLLLTLIMVMTMIPAVSARSADITYTVRPGSDTSFDVSDFESFYTKNCSGTFKYVEFQVGTSSYNNFSGYVTYEGDALSRTGLTSNDFYYDDSYYGDYPIKRLALEADKNAATDSIEIGFTVYGGSGNNTNQYAEGTLALEVSKSGSSSSSKGDITYTVKANDSVSLSGRDFEKFYDNDCSGTFKYVVFDRPSSSDYADGYIYYRYGKSKETYFSRSELNSYKFYYSDSDYGDYDLDQLSFVSDKSFSGPVKLSFTVYGGNGSKYNQSASGTLIISTTGSSSSSRGDITYTVKANDEVSFDSRDFKKFYENDCSGDFKYVVFSRPSSSDYADGYIYYRYGKSKETYFSRSELNSYKFYYSDSDYGDYDLDELSFVSDKSFSGPIKLTFTAYGGNGTRDNQSTTGTLVISLSGSNSSTKGDIAYTVQANDEVTFDSRDFDKFYDNNCSGTFKYVVFDRPSSSDYADGYIYYRYGKSKETYFSRSELNSYKFYYSDSDYGDYDLDQLSFVSDKSFSGPVKLSFTVYGGSGSKTNQSASGTLVISTGANSSTVSRYSGNIRYSTTPSTALQINPNDLARFYSKNVPGAALRYVVLTGIPSTGSLYYNYYGTSQYGVSSRMQLTSSSASGKVFSFSPSSTSEYALSELTYIPSGSNYCTAVSFAAYGSDGSTVTGSILISVTASAVAEVYTVATKGTSVSFPASSVYSAVSAATGSGLASIQLLELPTATSGVLYCGSTRADLTTNYSYTSSSDSMTQLRFVPNGAYTGSVSIPYVALGSSGTAIAAGTVSIGIVNSVKKFTDISTSTWCYKYITELSDANIISGYSNGSFQEKNTITYGAALKLIMLAAGYSEQAPTTKGSTFSGYLTRAKADGLVEGNPKLNGSITRLQIAQIAAKAMKLSVTNLSNKKPFTDTNDVYVQALNAAGIIEGYFANGSSTYKPNNTLTRGQVSAIVWRMRNYNK